MASKRTYDNSAGGSKFSSDPRQDRSKVRKWQASTDTTSTDRVKQPPTARALAHDWISAQVGLLKQLADNPELYEECLALAGTELMERATQIGESLRSKLPGLNEAARVQPAYNSNAPPFTGPPIPSHKSLLAESDVTGVRKPPVPKIHDAKLENLVFVHKSVPGEVQHKTDDNMQSYERLEFYGDAVLEMVATRLLWDWYPHEGAGHMSHLRERMIKNQTLAGFSLLYGFDDSLKTKGFHDYTKKVRGSAKASPGRAKMLADVFEAYIGAVVLSRPDDGFAAVEEWMAALWWPIVCGQSARVVDKWTKDELGKRVMSVGIKVTYEETEKRQPIKDGRDIFTVGAFLTGWGWFHHQLGEGEGNSMNEAGWQAAAEALKNPLVFQITQLKREFDRRVKEEKDREDGPRQEVLDAITAEFKPTK